MHQQCLHSPNDMCWTIADQVLSLEKKKMQESGPAAQQQQQQHARNNQFAYGVKAVTGQRPNMEDAYSVQMTPPQPPQPHSAAASSAGPCAQQQGGAGQGVNAPCTPTQHSDAPLPCCPQPDAACPGEQQQQCTQQQLQAAAGEQQGDACAPGAEDALQVPQLPEDLAVLSVFDGHGGNEVAEHCRESLHRHFAYQLSLQRTDEAEGHYHHHHIAEALRASFLCTDAELQGTEAGDYVGATAAVAVISKAHIIIAHAGDSRAVIQRGGKAESLTRDHKPDREDEMARIKAAGGRVVFSNGVHRVMGMLAMSRAIGDHFLRPYVIAHPEVICVERTPQDEVLVLATDGLWDVFSCKEATTLAIRCIARSKERGMSRHGACRVAASVLTKVALERGSRDNITVIVVDVAPQKQLQQKQQEQAQKQQAQQQQAHTHTAQHAHVQPHVHAQGGANPLEKQLQQKEQQTQLLEQVKEQLNLQAPHTAPQQQQQQQQQPPIELRPPPSPAGMEPPSHNTPSQHNAPPQQLQPHPPPHQPPQPTPSQPPSTQPQQMQQQQQQQWVQPAADAHSLPSRGLHTSGSGAHLHADTSQQQPQQQQPQQPQPPLVCAAQEPLSPQPRQPPPPQHTHVDHASLPSHPPPPSHAPHPTPTPPTTTLYEPTPAPPPQTEPPLPPPHEATLPHGIPLPPHAPPPSQHTTTHAHPPTSHTAHAPKPPLPPSALTPSNSLQPPPRAPPQPDQQQQQQQQQQATPSPTTSSSHPHPHPPPQQQQQQQQQEQHTPFSGSSTATSSGSLHTLTGTTNARAPPATSAGTTAAAQQPQHHHHQPQQQQGVAAGSGGRGGREEDDDDDDGGACGGGAVGSKEGLTGKTQSFSVGTCLWLKGNNPNNPKIDAATRAAMDRQRSAPNIQQSNTMASQQQQHQPQHKLPATAPQLPTSNSATAEDARTEFLEASDQPSEMRPSMLPSAQSHALQAPTHLQPLHIRHASSPASSGSPRTPNGPPPFLSGELPPTSQPPHPAPLPPHQTTTSSSGGSSSGDAAAHAHAGVQPSSSTVAHSHSLGKSGSGGRLAAWSGVGVEPAEHAAPHTNSSEGVGDQRNKSGVPASVGWGGHVARVSSGGASTASVASSAAGAGVGAPVLVHRSGSSGSGAGVSASGCGGSVEVPLPRVSVDSNATTASAPPTVSTLGAHAADAHAGTSTTAAAPAPAAPPPLAAVPPASTTMHTPAAGLLASQEAALQPPYRGASESLQQPPFPQVPVASSGVPASVLLRPRRHASQHQIGAMEGADAAGVGLPRQRQVVRRPQRPNSARSSQVPPALTTPDGSLPLHPLPPTPANSATSTTTEPTFPPHLQPLQPSTASSPLHPDTEHPLPSLSYTQHPQHDTSQHDTSAPPTSTPTHTTALISTSRPTTPTPRPLSPSAAPISVPAAAPTPAPSQLPSGRLSPLLSNEVSLLPASAPDAPGSSGAGLLASLSLPSADVAAAEVAATPAELSVATSVGGHAAGGGASSTDMI